MTHPALEHPANAAFAGGTHTYALRLPEPERSAAIRAGAARVMRYPGNQPSLDLGDLGEEWVLGGWFRDEVAWCLAAFELAGGII